MKKGDRWKKLLGIHIRELRVLNGWTQQEFSVLLRQNGFQRCSRALLSQIETGGATIRGHEIYYLRQVFGEIFESEYWKPFHERQAPAQAQRKAP